MNDLLHLDVFQGFNLTLKELIVKQVFSSLRFVHLLNSSVDLCLHLDTDLICFESLFVLLHQAQAGQQLVYQ